jgi:hypothetical protein
VLLRYAESYSRTSVLERKMIFACPGIIDSETPPQDETDLQSVCFSSTWQIPTPTTRPEIRAAYRENDQFVEGQVDSDQEIRTAGKLRTTS